jgi:hypothetical protein
MPVFVLDVARFYPIEPESRERIDAVRERLARRDARRSVYIAICVRLLAYVPTLSIALCAIFLTTGPTNSHPAVASVLWPTMLIALPAPAVRIAAFGKRVGTPRWNALVPASLSLVEAVWYYAEHAHRVSHAATVPSTAAIYVFVSTESTFDLVILSLIVVGAVFLIDDLSNSSAGREMEFTSTALLLIDKMEKYRYHNTRYRPAEATMAVLDRQFRTSSTLLLTRLAKLSKMPHGSPDHPLHAADGEQLNAPLLSPAFKRMGYEVDNSEAQNLGSLAERLRPDISYLLFLYLEKRWEDIDRMAALDGPPPDLTMWDRFPLAFKRWAEELRDLNTFVTGVVTIVGCGLLITVLVRAPHDIVNFFIQHVP